MRDPDEQPIGTINDVYLYPSDVDYSRRAAERYEAQAAQLESTAARAPARSRGGLIAQAKRATACARRHRQNLAAQLARVGHWGGVLSPRSVSGDWQ